MFDFFGRVICQKCKSHMKLCAVSHTWNGTQAVFSCDNPRCFDEEALDWQNIRIVLHSQKQAA